MFKVSHEVPISILEESRQFNDYDYALLHLTYEYPEYKQFYIDSIKMGREVLLDNSLFELGDALTLEQVAQGVKDLNPTWVVVPDCLHEKDITIERFKEWEDRYSDLDVMTIGVVQGKTGAEMDECYAFMSMNADKIAIPFDRAAFGDTLEEWCEGRPAYIKHLIVEGRWNNQKPHHLLGCSYAREFNNPLYQIFSIETVDTSNPIVAGIKRLSYAPDGLNEKPSIKLCDLIDAKLGFEQSAIIMHNVNTFKKICGR